VECHRIADQIVGPYVRVGTTRNHRFAVYRLNGSNERGSPPKPAAPGKTYPSPEAAAEALAQSVGGTVAAIWRWADDYYRARIALPNGAKSYRPVVRRGSGWTCGVPAKPWQLYCPGELPPSGLVYIVEGEKACDAGWSIGLPCVTSGGSTSASDVDWSVLAGRDTVILPDNDPPGRAYARAVVEALAKLNPPPRVRVVELPGLLEHGDLHDFVGLRDSRTAEEIRSEIESLVEATKPIPTGPDTSTLPPAVDAGDFLAEPLQMADPIVHGLLRRGEIATLTSHSKSRKSWSALQLCVAVATGSRWFDLQCHAGRALLIDCELQRPTLHARLRAVLEAAGLDRAAVKGRLSIACWRGRTVSVPTLSLFLNSIEAGQFDLIVLDPAFKLYPVDFDENSNADMGRFYNDFIGLAERAGAALLLCHHTPKGDTSSRTTIDLGAGAGAAGRAVDVAIALRAHEESQPGAPVVVRETISRSFPDLEPAVFRWVYPTWVLAPDLDPTRLATGRRPKPKTEPVETPPPEPAWTPERFVNIFVTTSPASRGTIIERAAAAGVSVSRARRLLEAAESAGLVCRHRAGPREPVRFSTAPVGELTL